MPLRKRLATACEVARLPAVSMMMLRSPSTPKVYIFLNVEMWSTPALVRVSEAKTMPSFRLRAAQ